MKLFNALIFMSTVLIGTMRADVDCFSNSRFSLSSYNYCKSIAEGSGSAAGFLIMTDMQKKGINYTPPQEALKLCSQEASHSKFHGTLFERDYINGCLELWGVRLK